MLGILLVSMFMYHVCAWSPGQKRAPDPLELELYIAAKWALGMEPLQGHPILFTTEPFLQPHQLLFYMAHGHTPRMAPHREMGPPILVMNQRKFPHGKCPHNLMGAISQLRFPLLM